jgi:hypothetical protein
LSGYSRQRQPEEISLFVDTYLRLNAQEQQEFQTELDTIEPVDREEIMQLTTSWMEQGLAQGRQEEAQSIILRQLIRRVGAVSEDVRSQIDRLSLPQMESLAEALLDFEEIADLSQWLQENQPVS